MQTLKAEITKLGTGDLEAYIDLRYESGAPQGELDALETAFAERVDLAPDNCARSSVV